MRLGQGEVERERGWLGRQGVDDLAGNMDQPRVAGHLWVGGGPRASEVVLLGHAYGQQGQDATFEVGKSVQMGTEIVQDCLYPRGGSVWVVMERSCHHTI